jgi:hypothetical protein
VDAGQMDSSAKASEVVVPIDIEVDMGSMGCDTKANGKHDGSMANIVITVDDLFFHLSRYYLAIHFHLLQEVV